MGRLMSCIAIPVLAVAVSAQPGWAQQSEGARGADAKAEGDVGISADRDGAGTTARVRADAEDQAADDLGRADDRRERQADRQDAREQSADQRDADRAADSRYRFHQGRWWYLTTSGNWLYWQNGRWNRFQSGGTTYSQAATPRHYGNRGYYTQPYYNNGYYNGGYYNNYYGNPGYNGYYNSGYRGMPYGYNGPGYGNRGWGNMNYGSRAANRGSNIGGMIDQGFGGSGQAGAVIGGAISR